MNVMNHKELHKLITDYAIEKNLSTNELLAFLTVTFVGTMEMIGKTQDFMDKTCDRMKLQFKEKRDERTK